MNAWDHALFRTINSGLGTPSLDEPMRLVSTGWIWWAAIVVLLGAALVFHNRQWIKAGLLGVVALTATNLIVGVGLKPFVHRLRPCHEMADTRVVDVCRGEYGFPSNHAANSMGVAVIALGTLPLSVSVPTLVFALLIGLSRVYLGAHFPGDVLAGFLIGAVTSWGLLKLSTKVPFPPMAGSTKPPTV